MSAFDFDVVILGSGISALTSAVLLGRKGKRVVVLEQHTKPGGYMHGFRRFGELYDSGAHYVGALGPRQPFRVLLEYMGVFDEALFAPLNPDGFDIMHFPAGTVTIPRGYQNVISELSAVFPGEREAIRKYFELVRATCRYFPTYRYNDVLPPTYPLRRSICPFAGSSRDSPRTSACSRCSTPTAICTGFVPRTSPSAFTPS
ncbi:MAG: NAD(P)-binding protein [Calothrix sp. SM1_5_4]|nr:NAD(P)-binding protein [Calothrix sp. SM1_5_4]